MMNSIAPMVKWISLLSSEQSFWVRVLVGAQHIKKELLSVAPFLCAFHLYQDSKDGSPQLGAGEGLSRGRERLVDCEQSEVIYLATCDRVLVGEHSN
jgi:hypothetical protein